MRREEEEAPPGGGERFASEDATSRDRSQGKGSPLAKDKVKKINKEKREHVEEENDSGIKIKANYSGKK